MTTYTAVCEREGNWWVINVPELECGGVVQARTLDEVPATVADVVALMTGADPAEIEVNVQAKAAMAAGSWQEAWRWLDDQPHDEDEVEVLDRLFLFQPIKIACACHEIPTSRQEDREGTWYLIRADFPTMRSAKLVKSCPGDARRRQDHVTSVSSPRPPQRKTEDQLACMGASMNCG